MKKFKPERSHPIIILTGFLASIKEFIFPIIFVFILQVRSTSLFFENNFFRYFILGSLLISILNSVLQWYFLKYSYSDGVLHVKSGVFVKKDRYIKKERVQTINTKAGILWRILDLVTMQIETAGAGLEPEVHIKAIDRNKAEYISKALEDEKSVEDIDATASVSESTRNVWEINYKRLILAGMTSSGLGIIFSFLAVIVGNGMAIVPGEFFSSAFRIFQNTQLMFIVMLVFLIFLLSWLISIVRFVMSYGGFTIVKDEAEIKITRGLIEKKELSLKVHRIQAIRIVEGLLRQPFGYAIVEVEVAGGASEDSGFKTILNPMIKKSEIEDFISFVSPDRAYCQDFKNLPQKALRRYITRSTVPLLPLLVIFYLVSNPFVWAGLLILPISWFLGYLRYKDGSYVILDQNIIFRYRIIARTTVLMKKSQIQSIELKTNFIQKAKNLTTISSTVLTAMLSATFTVKDISRESGEELWAWFTRE
ncbi:PH domain-containing protein [Proteinivorax tanatarense]|uniref:PH domain-containing protein n=1 Tax=Proteinivorax tanatarense TaxID=1260629 RepID=A0AAU7VKI4_9FIRM